MGYDFIQIKKHDKLTRQESNKYIKRGTKINGIKVDHD